MNIHIHIKFKTRVKNSKVNSEKHTQVYGMYVQGCISSRLLYNQPRPNY